MALESINVGNSPDEKSKNTSHTTQVEVEYVEGNEEDSLIDSPVDGDFDESTVEINLEIEDDDSVEEEVLEDEEDLDEDSAEEAPVEKDEKPKEDQKESRSQKRIRELVAQKNEERARVQKLQDENFELQKQMAITQNQTMETQKILLEGNIEALKSQLAQATDEGETQKAIDIQLQLNDAQTKLSKVSEYTPIDLEKLENSKNTSNSQNNNSEVVMSEATQDWMEENPWFMNPSTSKEIERVEAAIVFSQKLERLGKTMEDPNFFVLVDEYLEKFDEALARGDKNSVSSNQDSSEEPDVKKPTKQKKVVRQTVQGASRTPTSSTKSSTRKTPKKIKLTAEQARLARLFDMTPLEYWEELQKESEKSTRMTTIDTK